MPPEAAAAPAATPANFMDHVSAQDAGGDSAIPDHSPQVRDETPPPAAPPVDPGAPTDPPLEEAPLEEPIPDEAAELETLRTLKAELESGLALPEALHAKTMPVKIDGRVYDVPIAELAKGYQRQTDYSRKLAEVKQYREETQQMRGGMERLLTDLNNPESLIRAAKEVGFYKALVDAAKHIGKQRLALMELPEGERALRLQLEQLADERELEGRRRAALERQLQEQQAQRPNDDAVRIRHQLDQLVPRAFEKAKLTDYPLSRQLFAQNMQNLHEGGDVTAELCDAAVQATLEQLADIAARMPQGQPANGNGARQPMPPRRAAPAAGRPVVRKASGTPADFASHLERLNGSR